MIETTIRAKYFNLLRSHFANPQEDYLAQAAELGKALVMANIPPEEIAELHEDAIQRLGAEFPDAKLIGAANLISQPLMELLMVYGLAFRERLDERERAEEALRASETEKKSILNAISDVVVFQDKSLSIRWVNDAAARSVGKTPQELVGCHCYELWHGQSEACEGCPVLRAQETGSSAGGIMTTPDGKWWEITAEPVRDIDEKIVGAMEIARDITDRKHAEDQLKASLKEKEALLLEIHHRVKNSLQVVSSMLNMQARTAKDEDVKDILSEARNRINTMALIHSQLYESGNLSEINMKGFMDKLLVQLLQIHSVPDREITPVVQAVECSLPISIAVPVGLIANELLTNAFKHAFVNRKEGKIEVSLRASEKGVVSLTVSDDGVGLPEGFDVNTSKTLGLHVVKILAEDQLDGKLEVVSDKGTTCGTTCKVEFEMAEGL